MDAVRRLQSSPLPPAVTVLASPAGAATEEEVTPVVTDTCNSLLTARLPFMPAVGGGMPPSAALPSQFLKRKMRRELGWWRKENNLNIKTTMVSTISHHPGV